MRKMATEQGWLEAIEAELRDKQIYEYLAEQGQIEAVEASTEEAEADADVDVDTDEEASDGPDGVRIGCLTILWVAGIASISVDLGWLDGL